MKRKRDMVDIAMKVLQLKTQGNLSEGKIMWKTGVKESTYQRALDWLTSHGLLGEDSITQKGLEVLNYYTRFVAALHSKI